MKIKNIKKTLFVFLISSFLLLVIVPGTMAIFSEKETTKINLNVETPTFTVTFDANGGTSSIASKDIAYLHEYGELPEGYKCGSTFLGWYTGIDTGVKIEEDSIFDIMDEQTLYARYSDNKELYDVLKCEAERTDILAVNRLAATYTGEHQDSMDPTKSTENIYHWYATDDTKGDAVLDKNNVLFAGQCWQMMRTTDTGGVKMIYNGEAENDQCLSTRGTHTGYASRTIYSLNSDYWYGTDYTYDVETKTFKVSGTTEQATWSEETGQGLIGKYTCKLTNEDDSCSILYLVDGYLDASYAYVIPLNSNSHYSQFGTLQYNYKDNALSYVGYMYNTVYPVQKKAMTGTETMFSSTSLGTTYWYANSVTWGTPVANYYNLDNPYKVNETSEYPNLVGKYTFRSSKSNYAYTTVYYIAAVNNSTFYYIQLGDETGTTHDLSFYNYSYTYGDSFRSNEDGTYTINSPTATVERKNWYTSYSNVINKYVCKNAVNDTCSELWYVTSATNTSMTYIKVSNVYKYAKSFEYKLDPDDGTYKYFLDEDTSTIFWDLSNNNNRTSISNAHYTCWNTTGKCTTISYIYYLSLSTAYSINLTEGKNVETAINEMLYNDNVNTTSSIIKIGLDAWYKHYLLQDYDDYIEDTIFCNERSIKELNGWNPDGGSISSQMLKFKEYNTTSDLSCTNITDRFSTTNTSAQLTYKVGLMTSPEMNILNNRLILKTGQYYWLATPHWFQTEDAGGRRVDKGGSIGDAIMSYTALYANYGVRPAVSLIPGIKYSEGDGSKATPYIVKLDY